EQAAQFGSVQPTCTEGFQCQGLKGLALDIAPDAELLGEVIRYVQHHVHRVGAYHAAVSKSYVLPLTSRPSPGITLPGGPPWRGPRGTGVETPGCARNCQRRGRRPSAPSGVASLG